MYYIAGLPIDRWWRWWPSVHVLTCDHRCSLRRARSVKKAFPDLPSATTGDTLFQDIFQVVRGWHRSLRTKSRISVIAASASWRTGCERMAIDPNILERMLADNWLPLINILTWRGMVELNEKKPRKLGWLDDELLRSSTRRLLFI